MEKLVSFSKLTDKGNTLIHMQIVQSPLQQSFHNFFTVDPFLLQFIRSFPGSFIKSVQFLNDMAPLMFHRILDNILKYAFAKRAYAPSHVITRKPV